MKHFIVACISFILSLSFLPSLFPAYAAGPCPDGFEALCKLDPDTNPNAFSSLFSGIIAILLIIAVIVSIIFLIWGGIRWIKSNGDKAQIEQARSTIIAAGIGLIIAFLAFFIINLVLSLFGISSFKLDIPKLV